MSQRNIGIKNLKEKKESSQKALLSFNTRDQRFSILNE